MNNSQLTCNLTCYISPQNFIKSFRYKTESNVELVFGKSQVQLLSFWKFRFMALLKTISGQTLPGFVHLYKIIPQQWNLNANILRHFFFTEMLFLTGITWLYSKQMICQTGVQQYIHLLTIFWVRNILQHFLQNRAFVLSITKTIHRKIQFSFVTVINFK